MHCEQILRLIAPQGAQSVDRTRIAAFEAAVRAATSKLRDARVEVAAAGLPITARVSATLLDDVFVPLAVALSLCAAAARKRVVLAVSAPAGAGKSVFAALLCHVVCVAWRAVEERCAADTQQLMPSGGDGDATNRGAVVVGIDGYHRRNTELDALGLRRDKGRPATFDVERLVHDVAAMRAGDSEVAIPAYSRVQHEPVEGAYVLPAMPATPIVIVEGILLFTKAFDGVTVAPDIRLWLDVPKERAMARVNARKVAGGRSHADTEAHYARVDGPNHDDMLRGVGTAALKLRDVGAADDDAVPQWVWAHTAGDDSGMV